MSPVDESEGDFMRQILGVNTANAAAPEAIVSSSEDKVAASRAIGRALDIIQALATSEGSLKCSDLVHQTSIPKSTVHRILTTLVSAGFVARVGARYSPGPVLRDFTEKATTLDLLQATLMPILVELHESTRGAASIGMPLNGRVQQSAAVHSWNYPVRSREMAPMHQTAVGQLVLAYGAATSQFAGPLPQTFEVRALSAELAEVRRRGIAFSRAAHHRDEIAIAAPIFVGKDHFIAGIQIAGINGQFDVADAVKHVTLAATTASQHIARHRYAAWYRGRVGRNA
jgi:DNA-binding IclR family transcriptional regulator